jgi:hypothetical protein
MVIPVIEILLVIHCNVMTGITLITYVLRVIDLVQDNYINLISGVALLFG